MRSDLLFQISGFVDPPIYPISSAQKNPECFLSGLPQQAMVNVSDFHGYI